MKVQIEDLGNKVDDLESRSRQNNLCFEGILVAKRNQAGIRKQNQTPNLKSQA